MCGIAGILDFQKKINNPIQLIKKLNVLNKSRGPDNNNIWTDKDQKIFFGHTRLSIIDLSNKGCQPFFSIDKKITLIFNGEIYNYKELKKILIEKNYNFFSNSDTEVILHSYSEWGMKFINKLRGMFAISIWDDNIKKLILIKDQFGIKPLYYSIDNKIFCFSSSIKSLINSKIVSDKKSPTSYTNYLLWGNTIDPDTIYEKIKSVEKGTYVVIDEYNNVVIKKYTDLIETIQNVNRIVFKNTNEAKSYLKEIIHETVNAHLVSDVNLGVALSSGLDSNLILDNIEVTHLKNIQALTVDFNIDGSVTDEKKIAKEFSLKKNIKHKIFNLNNLDINSELNSFFKEMDTPTNDGFNTYVLSKFAKQNDTKVLLTGVGADELFSGYPSFYRAKNYLYILKLLANLNFNQIPKKTLLFLSQKFNFNSKFSEIFNVKSLLDLFLLTRRVFLNDEIKDILNEYKIENKSYIANPTIIDPNFNNMSINEQLMYLEIEYYLCPKLLKDSDWSSMSNSIELRTPFVDWKFFNNYLKLFKSNIKIDKKFVYETFKETLPTDLKDRKKSSFGIPHNYLLNKLNININSKHNLKKWSLASLDNYFNYNK